MHETCSKKSYLIVGVHSYNDNDHHHLGDHDHHYYWLLWWLNESLQIEGREKMFFFMILFSFLWEFVKVGLFK